MFEFLFPKRTPDLAAMIAYGRPKIADDVPEACDAPGIAGSKPVEIDRRPSSGSS
jgi:hypothetical protein